MCSAPKTIARALMLSVSVGVAAQAQTTIAPATPQTSSAQADSTDLTLDAALTQLSQAPSVTASRLSVQVAQANLNAARTALGLTVGVSGGAAYSAGYDTTTTVGGVSTPVSVASSLGGNAGVNVSLGVLPWSSNQYGLRAAQRSLALAEAYLTDAEHTGRLNVAQQYYNVVSAQQSVKLAEQTVALRQRQLSVAQTQQAQENATAENVLTAQVSVQTAQSQLAQAQGSLQTAKLSLGAALGSDVTGKTFTSLPPEVLTLPDLNALVASARNSRSEVVKARNDYAAAQDTLEQNQINYNLPGLTAGVSFGPNSNSGLNASLDLKKGTLSGGYTVPWGDSVGSTPHHLSASLSASYVVYSPAQKAQLAADRANVTQTQLSLNVQQQNVELDVRTKYNALQNALLSLQAGQTQVQLAQASLQTAQSRLLAGLGTQDDVTGAELSLAQAQSALQTARVTAHLALIQLNNAAGGQP